MAQRFDQFSFFYVILFGATNILISSAHHTNAKMFLTYVASFKREMNRLSDNIRFYISFYI